MKRIFHAIALAAALALAGRAWAQAPRIPTSPDDPASKSLGWVEAAPASQAAAPGAQAIAPASEPVAPASQPAAPSVQTTAPASPPASPSVQAAAPASQPDAPAAQPVAPAPSRTTEKAAPSRAKPPQKHARETAPELRNADRRAQPTDRVANQLNRQELGTLSAGGATASAPRR
jgi:hypothetical protein